MLQGSIPPPYTHRVNDFKVPSLVGLGLDEVDKWWANHHKGALAALGDFARDVLGGQQQGEGTVGGACMCVAPGRTGGS